MLIRASHIPVVSNCSYVLGKLQEKAALALSLQISTVRQEASDTRVEKDPTKSMFVCTVLAIFQTFVC